MTDEVVARAEESEEAPADEGAVAVVDAEAEEPAAEADEAEEPAAEADEPAAEAEAEEPAAAAAE